MSTDDVDRLDEVIDHVVRSGTTMAWDVDGTLFDPQPRMHKTVEAFIGDAVAARSVTRAWQSTAKNLGLDDQAFFAFWHEFFWTASHFLFDAPVRKTVSRARRLNAENNVIITGRNDTFVNVTARQLDIVGISAEHIMTKPHGAETAAFKAEAIVRLADEGRPLAAFVTDCPHEIAAVNHVARDHDVPAPMSFLCVPHNRVADARATSNATYVLTEVTIHAANEAL